MDDGVSRKATWWLSGALLFVLGVGVFLYMELHRLSDRVQQQRTYVLRTVVRDALLHRTLPELTLPSARGDSAPLVLRGDRPNAIWFVDPERCVQCLERLSDWRRMVQHSGVRAVAVLEGTGGEAARGIIRETGLTGTVLYDSARVWRRSLPQDDWPAMVMLGVDGEGRIQSVASRENRGSCRWSAFDYTLAAVRQLGGTAEAGQPPLAATGGR